MGMGDCLRCVKYLLFVFNLIFCLIGLAILAIGVWLYVRPATEIDSGLGDAVKSVQYAGLFFIIIGSVIALLGFLGCCGAIFENRCLLVLFFILLLLVFLILLAAGVALLVMYDCCGAQLAEKDYIRQNLTIPESCKPAQNKAYVSCTLRFDEHLSQNTLKIAIAIFVTAVVALLGMVFSMMLCCAISDMA